MELENRYLVLKWKDIEEALTSYEQYILQCLATSVQEWRLSQGKKQNRYVCINQDELYFPTVLKFMEDMKGIKDLLADALYNDEGHHKQWYLWRIAEALGLDLSDEWDEEYPEPDKGIAP